MEWNLWNTGKVADPKSPVGGSYAFMKPKPQSVEISNSSFVLQFASRRFLDQLLGPGEDRARANRQLKDAEFGNKDIGNLQVKWVKNGNFGSKWGENFRFGLKNDFLGTYGCFAKY